MTAEIIHLNLPRRVHLFTPAAPWPAAVLVTPSAGVEMLSAMFVSASEARGYAVGLAHMHGWPISIVNRALEADDADGGVAA